jgi:hypothetical protein
MNHQAVETAQKRLRILGDNEIEGLYGRPRFTSEEREQFFAVTPPEQALLQEFPPVPSQVFFILHLGYCKAKQLFFVCTLPEVAADVQYVLARYFPQASDTGR